MPGHTSYAGVVASGQGARLAKMHPSKALVTVGGRPLIDHVLGQLEHAGVRHLFISVRPDDSMLHRYLETQRRVRFNSLTVLDVSADVGSGGATRAVTKAIGAHAHLLCTVDFVGPPDLALAVAHAGERREDRALCVLLVAPLQRDTQPAWVSVDVDGEVKGFGKESPPSQLVYGNIRWMSAKGASALQSLPSFVTSRRDSHLVQALIESYPHSTFAHFAPIVFDVDDEHDLAIANAWLSVNRELVAASRR